MRFSRGLIVISSLIVVALIVACGPSEPKVDPAVEAEWVALTEAKEKLDAMRKEIREVKAMVSVPADEAPAAGDADAEEAGAEPMPSPEELAAKAAELDKQVVELADEFNGRLAAFLNDPANQIFEGEPLTERQAAAVAMKSSEDIELAREYVEKGGDHRRAIDILTVALQLDPDNAALQAALEEAEANRFLSEERFALAKKGMTEQEVREVLGQVNLRNIRKYAERKPPVMAWFYPTAEGGAAAAVWFREDKGEQKVYQLKYDAVGGPGEE